MNRRQFLKASAGLTASSLAFHVVPRHVLGQGQVPPSEKLNIAGVGIGGQGGGVLNDLASQNIVALCDIDSKKAAGTFKKFEKAERFKDYRVMLEKAGKSFDAVMVATPDHMHAPISLAALRAGKHVYVEKPMAHTIEEARVMTRVAKETGLVTQMGNNGHAGEGLRQTREWILAGAIGTVKEIHCWSDRPGVVGAKQWWPQPAKPYDGSDKCPENIDWDLFLGAAPDRPYNPNIHPFAWRGYFDYGTGALGDMAVHNMDPAFYALDLEAPIAAEAKTTELGKDSYPAQQTITYEFAAKDNRPAVKIIWYDGGLLPAAPEALEGRKVGDNGILFIGDKGVMLCGGWSGVPALFPAARRREFQQPEKSIPRSSGHRSEFVEACKMKKPEHAKAGFWYSGTFVESLLVGNLAVRLQKRIEWDSKNMKATNAPEADALIKKVYRKGFGI